jgi:hypothetical protein
MLPLPPRVTILHIWIYSKEEDIIPYQIWGQNVKGQVLWISKLKYALQALVCYPFHLKTLYHTYGLPMEGRCFLSNLGSNCQRSANFLDSL